LLHIALIPARGGSISIRNKNLQLLGEKTLVQHAWDACLGSGIFNTTLLSTDSPEIARNISTVLEFNKMKDDEIKFIDNLSAIHRRLNCDADTLSPIKNVLFKLANRKDLEFDFIWLIQPTTPFRKNNDFQELIQMINLNLEWSSIVSVKDCTNLHPSRMYTLKYPYIENYVGIEENDGGPRQLLSKVFIKDGGFYIFKRNTLKNGIFLGPRVIPFIRSSSHNVNIDTQEDLDFARFLEQKKEVN
jgi:CMP-N,N'-diacetyllegionaminic acid synthase